MEMNQLQGQIDGAAAVIKQTAGENEACRRLVAIPGIGTGHSDCPHRGNRQRNSI
jgi:hypothetical protein